MSTRANRATGRTKVNKYESTAYDEMVDAPSLLDVRVEETFTGDIDGEGAARVLHAARKDGHVTFVGLERVRGAIGGRKGSFLLQVSGTIVAKKMKAECFVLPRSGTGELEGLRGEGGFEAELGEHGSVWLDYSLE